jgi:hypothetical protein
MSCTALAQCISDSDKVLRNDDAIRQYCSGIANTIYAEMGELNLAPKS